MKALRLNYRKMGCIGLILPHFAIFGRETIQRLLSFLRSKTASEQSRSEKCSFLQKMNVFLGFWTKKATTFQWTSFETQGSSIFGIILTYFRLFSRGSYTNVDITPAKTIEK
jgi:hypothetical protein